MVYFGVWQNTAFRLVASSSDSVKILGSKGSPWDYFSACRLERNSQNNFICCWCRPCWIVSTFIPPRGGDHQLVAVALDMGALLPQPLVQRDGHSGCGLSDYEYTVDIRRCSSKRPPVKCDTGEILIIKSGGPQQGCDDGKEEQLPEEDCPSVNIQPKTVQTQ